MKTLQGDKLHKHLPQVTESYINKLKFVKHPIPELVSLERFYFKILIKKTTTTRINFNLELKTSRARFSKEVK